MERNASQARKRSVAVFAKCAERWEGAQSPYCRKNLIGFRYKRENSSSSITSIRRSPDSHLDTNDCGRRSAVAASAWVKPA